MTPEALRAGGFEPVARDEAVAEGGLLAVTLGDGSRVVLTKHDGEIGALRDCCTHRDFPLSEGEVLPDGTIECAWHGARFCARTGVVMHGPASKPIPAFAVRIVDGEIWIGKA